MSRDISLDGCRAGDYDTGMDAVRQVLTAAAKREGASLIGLSRLLGRNGSYLQQFVNRGSPRVLPERERAILADYLGLAEETLGGRPARALAVRRFEVAASAGPGALADDEGEGVAHLPLAMVAGLAADPAALTLIAARGDSMLPTIADGDDILVDTGDRRVGRRGAVFVLRIDGAVVVKRLRLAAGLVEVASDNPAAGPIGPIPADAAEVIGRVVWLGRRV